MGRPTCKICRMVTGSHEGLVRCHRSGTSREYIIQCCVSCWLALMYILEDISQGYTDSLPVEVTAASNKAFVKRHRQQVVADARDQLKADQSTHR